MPDKISEIFVKIINEYNRLIDEKNSIAIKLKIWKEYSDVGQRMYHEKCDELDKVLEEKERVEYDRDYYEKYSKELLCEINRLQK